MDAIAGAATATARVLAVEFVWSKNRFFAFGMVPDTYRFPLSRYWYSPLPWMPRL